jgi:hypothetical protein
VCSGSCRDSIPSWREANNVEYVIGLAKNTRLTKIIGGELHEAKQQFLATGQAARVFKDFSYRTKKSWSRERRVIGKAEHLTKQSVGKRLTRQFKVCHWLCQCGISYQRRCKTKESANESFSENSAFERHRGSPSSPTITNWMKNHRPRLAREHGA